jgi:hypothetical protein
MQKKEVSFALFQIVLQNREPGTSTRMSGNGCQALTDGKWGFRTMPISIPGQADHSFRDDGDHDSGMMPITRSGMIPIS